jgi:hypothetical protein
VIAGMSTTEFIWAVLMVGGACLSIYALIRAAASGYEDPDDR